MPPIRCANAPSVAKLFVQLSARSSNPILDVLLPPRTQARAFYAHAARNNAPRTPSTPMPSRAAANATARRQSVVDGNKRTFSTSGLLAKTLAIHNPQTDEDGNEMALEITPRAANVGDVCFYFYIYVYIYVYLGSRSLLLTAHHPAPHNSVVQLANPRATDNHSASPKSCPRTRTPSSRSASKSSRAGATASSTSCR